MDEELAIALNHLSSSLVCERKTAIKGLKKHAKLGHAHLARLSLHYISEHDPCYTVRNLARQALYGSPHEVSEDHLWDKAYGF